MKEFCESYIGQYCIVRCYMSGVHIGVLKAYDPEIRHAIIENPRCIWYWTERFTLYEISQEGVGDDSKLTIKIPEVLVTDVIEIIKTSPAARDNMESMRAYDPNGR